METATTKKPTTQAQPGSAIDIDEAVKQVERLYRAVVGTEPPKDLPHTEIPPEKDPGVFVNAQIERLIETLGMQAQPPMPPTPAWAPAATISEERDAYLIDVELAGVKRDDVRITVLQGVMEIAGTRNVKNGQSGRQIRMSERPLGSFRRLLPLPQGCNPASMSAQLSDGVLSIRVPRGKAEDATPRHVTIS
jgi:HSP20 family protein